MSDQTKERVDFGDPSRAAIILHQFGVGLLTKTQMGEEINGNDIAEGLAYVLLTLAGQARNAAVQMDQARRQGSNIVVPKVFQGV